MDWQKLVFPEKIDSVQEKLNFPMKIKQNEKSTFILKGITTFLLLFAFDVFLWYPLSYCSLSFSFPDDFLTVFF